MLRTNEDRRKAFKKALIDSGLTQQEWAEQQGVTDNHLYLVVAGRRESRRLLAKVDAFIAQHNRPRQFAHPEPLSA